MANNLSANPIQLTADLASFQGAQTLRPGQKFPLRVRKITLSVGSSASVAGTVTITDPITGIELAPAIPVAAGTAAHTVIYNDDLPETTSWADFDVAGLTATGTTLLVWYKA